MRTPFCCLMLAVVVVGCSSSTYEASDRVSADKSTGSSTMISAGMPEASMEYMYGEQMSDMMVHGLGNEKFGIGMGMRGVPAKRDQSANLAVDNRKIIYSADMSIVVEEFDSVESSVASLVKRFGGFIADSNIDTKNRKRRRGTWKVRIPVSKFEAFLNEAGSLGVPVSRSQQAQDVTDEYVDITARISNKKKLEARILELLERPDDKIQYVIEVEKELGRVREEIERMEGRVRYLDDKIDLTTVALSIREEKEYRPPSRPGLSGRISKAWNSSLSRTQRFLEDTIVWLAGNVLPILFWSSVGIVAFVVIRRRLNALNTHES